MPHIHLNQHAKTISGVFPPVSYVEKHVIQDHVYGHVFWRETRRNHGHDSDGQAYLEWKVKPTRKTLFDSHGRYTVARLLLEHRGEAYKAMIRCLCGLPQCINLAHWRPVDKKATLQLAPTRDGWALLDLRTGKPQVKPQLVRISIGDVVHQVSVAPGATPFLLCGAPYDPEVTQVTSRNITCTRGCL